MAAQTSTKAPSRRGRRALVVAAVTALVLGTAAAVGGTYYVDSVVLGDELVLPKTTTLYYADGSVLAELGDIRRFPLEYDTIDPALIRATVAADDPDFWTGTATAITRSVVRQMFDLGPDAPRARMAVLAWKLEDQLSREQILEHYLNGMLYGRQAYGIEAAARAYFGKSARTDAPAEQRLTQAEAIALAAMPRQPEADPVDPTARPGYDPTRGSAAEEQARQRFIEIRTTMVKLGYLQAGDETTYPPVASFRPLAPGTRLDEPVGLVASHVLSELTADNPRSPFNGWQWQAVREGGFQIHTTIDPRVQDALEQAAGAAPGSPLAGQPVDLRAAAVLVEPGTGRILGYYGGPDGAGADLAGVFRTENDEMVGFGAHPPGGSFVVHTLAAALDNGYSLRSRWNIAPHDSPGRPPGNPVLSTGRCPGGADVCTLAEATTPGLETTFYDLTVSLSPKPVLEMARDAGITAMWTDDRARVDLLTGDLSSLVGNRFGHTVGIGQYPVTVLDQANAMATYAADGLPAQAHFVTKVINGEALVYGESLPADDAPRILRPQAIADLTWALKQNPAGAVPGHESANRPGQWEYADNRTIIGDAWMVGFTRSFGLAVWVGAANGKPIKLADGTPVMGASLPAAIYRQAMAAAHSALDRPALPFPPPVFVGDAQPPGSAP